jgi:hypothetical protein
MATCESCGNEYYKTFDVVMDGEVHTFDCFECAIAKLAPTCAHCGISIIGHGVEGADVLFCCANCAKAFGITKVAA